MNYFDDPAHRQWSTHYSDIYDDSDVGLAFTQAWADQVLAAVGYDGSHASRMDVLLCDTVDTKTGVVYRYPIYLSLADYVWAMVDDDGNDIPAVSLQGYFYSSHHCQCHRESDCEDAGKPPEEEEFECEGDRFKVVKIVFKTIPDLVLYSETMTIEELERSLGKP